MAKITELYQIGAENVRAQNLQTDITKKIQIMTKTASPAQKPRELSEDEQKEVKSFHRDWYFGMVWKNWASGMTLGAAWQSGLDSIRKEIRMVSEFYPENPIVKYLVRAAGDFEKRWQEIDSPHANDHMGLKPEEVAKQQKSGQDQKDKGCNGLNKMILENEPKQQVAGNAPQIQNQQPNRYLNLAIDRYYQNERRAA